MSKNYSSTATEQVTELRALRNKITHNFHPCHTQLNFWGADQAKANKKLSPLAICERGDTEKGERVSENSRDFLLT